MSLENAIVIGLTLSDTPEATLQGVEQVRALQTQGHRVIVIACAGEARRTAGVNKANRLPASADAFEIARTMLEPDLRAGEALAQALLDSGIDAALLAPEERAPLTRGGALDAEPRVLDASAFSAALGESPVVILAGGVGRDFDGQLTSLGADGGALSAVFVADRLALPLRIQLEAGESALPRKAALFARKHSQGAALVSPNGLELGEFDPAGEPGPIQRPNTGEPLRVSLLGLGPVGRGVLDELLSAPDRYRVVGVALTSADARYASGLAPELVSFDANEILTRRADVVINLTAEEPALDEVVEQALLRGVNVVRGAGALAVSTTEISEHGSLPFVAPDPAPQRRLWRGLAARRVSH